MRGAKGAVRGYTKGAYTVVDSKSGRLVDYAAVRCRSIGSKPVTQRAVFDLQWQVLVRAVSSVALHIGRTGRNRLRESRVGDDRGGDLPAADHFV